MMRNSAVTNTAHALRCLRATRSRLSVRSYATSSAASSASSPIAPALIGLLAGASLVTVYTSLGSDKVAAQSSAIPRKAERQRPFSTDFKDAIAELRTVFKPEQVVTDEDDLLVHAQTAQTWHKGPNPHAVCYPQSTEDVQKAVLICRKYRMPVTAFAGGTALEGHTTAIHGGLSLDMNHMNKVLKINAEDGDAVVQAGVGWQQLNETLDDESIPLFFPIDPGPGASIGGLISNGSSGTNAMRYGTARGEWILNVTVVLPNGKILKTRSRARKSSAGFDLTKLFTGAEGTLGIITEATVRLAPKLPTRVAICSFPNVKSAVECVNEVIIKGVPLQCAELCDTVTMNAINKAALTNYKFDEADSIFFKFQGEDKVIDLAVGTVKDILRKHGGKNLKFAKNAEESEEIWHARKTIHWSAMALLPGCTVYSTDVCVPISALPALVAETQEDLKRSGQVAPILGHVGDGNFHCSLLVGKDEDFPAIDALAKRMVERAQRLEGTCTGEHAVGTGKKKYLRKELGDNTVELMQLIKDTIDPSNIMNPGKLYPNIE